jgi:hypothetical protein
MIKISIINIGTMSSPIKLSNVEEQKLEEAPESQTVTLQLSDVIRLQAPTNQILNNNTFVIDYIDKNQLNLINVNDLTATKMKINEDGTLGDGSITSIALIDRNDKPGYARQNNLLPNTWVNIYFGGDTPVVITGEITNLEEDMIEIKTYPDNDTLYINFGYKGIPLDLPIETIEIREKPDQIVIKEKEKEKTRESLGLPESDESLDVSIASLADSSEEDKRENANTVYNLPVRDIKDTVREFIVRADEIKIGEELDAITQYVEVDQAQQRFNIHAQTDDLLNELLSNIPNTQRTGVVLNNIHTMIERFKQLRSEFSKLDEYGNVIGPITKTVAWKPLVKNLTTFKNLLFWLLPVAKNIKKVYNISSKEDVSESPDIIPLTIDQDIDEMKTIFDRYKSNDIPSDQNKYFNLLSEMNPYLTPFQQTDAEATFDIITDVPILNDVNAIIDNLGDFYSSIAENDIIKTKKFVIQRYNLGVNRLDATQITSSKMISHRVNVTQPDALELRSIVTLPEPVIRFSHINLPETNILDKANLNNTFINYWQLLNDSARVNRVNIDNFETDLDFSEKKFVNNIKNYVLVKGEKMEGLTNYEIYKEFLQKIVPKTRVLFNLMKKYINGKLSFHDVVGYLEPFLIYTDDLTFMQYKDIDSFLQYKISEYNKNFKEREKSFSLLKKRTASFGYRPSANYILSLITDRKINNEVFVDSYDYDQTQLKLTNSELIWRMKTTDYSNIFDNALALANIGTMLPENIGSIIENIEKSKDELDEDIKNEEKNNKCMNIVIAKQYKTLEEVAVDNDKITYFDKKFDDTMYGMLDDYQKEQISMAPEDFYEFLVQKLISKNKISTKDSPRLAETLINGMKRVVDGDFAMVFVNEQDKIIYFKRSNNRWVTDNTIDEKTITANQNLLCEFQKDCIEVDKKYKALCETQDLNKKHITENALKEIVGQFDKKYELSKDKLKELLNKNLDYSLSIIDKLHQIQHTKTYKYNAQQYKIGAEAGDFDNDIIVSPYNKLKDLILGQSNMTKRQNDIVKFAIRFTREANETDGAKGDEHWRHWRYCLKTNVKLLPNFLYRLAACWVEDHDNFMRVMDEIIKESGKLSDDGDSWVDEHSGYVICPRDFDVEEGYEQGYKVKTREVMEQDLGDALLNSSLKPVIKKYTTPETKMMSNVISALAENMGINVDDQKDFMIKIVSDTISAGVLISEEDHKRRIEEEAKKGKKLPSYISVYNSTILYLTLGAFLFGVQTSIPSIKTRKTFPGCVRSFTGYPFEGSGDLSSLKYLACIAYKIRSSTVQPWSALMGFKETTVTDKIKAFIDNYYLTNADVMQKCKDKLEYLLANPNESVIPSEHELARWIQFLPPLVPFKLKPITNISNEFKKQCLHDFKNGATCQREKIMVIKSKIIFFSLAIQELIQKVLSKRNMLLKNSANEPFLETACCSEKGNMSTIKYFAEEEPEIVAYNNIVQDLSNIIDDINAVAKAPMFFCKDNSKNVYAPLSDQYNDETIYRAFIVFCKFNSIVPISQELDAICGGKPDHFSNIDSISEKIRKLKQEGKNYNNSSLTRLLQYVNRKNIININVDSPVITQVQQLRNILEEISKDDETVVPAALMQNLDEVLDTYDIAVNEDTEEMRKLKNYLGRVNKEMKTELVDFISKNAGLTKKVNNDIKLYLNKLMEWGASSEESLKTSISDDATYNSIEFIKNYIHKFLNVFPDIIKNKVDYQNSIQIPNYWGLSQKHANDVRSIINEYYKGLRPFYGDKVVSNILATIPKTTKNLLKLALSTPYMCDIYYKGTKTHSVVDKRTCDMLFENYFLQILLEFKKLSEDPNMLVREMGENESEVFTVEDLEETALHLSAKPVSRVLLGNIKDMRTRTSKMLAAFLTIMSNHKDIVDLSYDKIMEVVFKSKEREKDTFTDRLKAMTDEERDADTILKINKLGAWSKGLQKGLTTYVKETYDEEREYMEKIADIEKNLRKNKNVTDENMEQYLEDYMENADAVADIEREENDIGWFNGDDAGEDYFGAEQGEDDWEERE